MGGLAARAPRLPLAGILYLGIGVAVGPWGLRLLDPVLPEDGHRLEALTEITLLLALFCVALRLRTPLTWAQWRAPSMLATFGLGLTVLLVAGAAHVFFDLGFLEGVLLGAIVAPVDPVRAAEVPLATDEGETRSVLSMEGALSSVLAVPVAVLALGLIGSIDGGPSFGRWLATEILWGLGAAAALGWTVGALIVRRLDRLDPNTRDSFPDELWLAGALIASVVLATVAATNTFAAALACGLAIGHGGRRTGRASARALTPRAVRLGQRVERLAEIMAVLLLGALLAASAVRPATIFFAAFALVVVRPLAAWLALARSDLAAHEQYAVGWYGVRGLASVYCLMFAANQGIESPLLRELTALAVAIVAGSIIMHGFAGRALAPRERLGDAPH